MLGTTLGIFMNYVKSIYQEYKKEEMKEAVEGWQDSIYAYASQNRKEKDDLIEIFENEEDYIDKLQVADILARLNCSCIIPFLMKMLNAHDSDDKYDAAIALVKLKSEYSQKALESLVESKMIPQHWFVNDLREIGTPFALDLLQKLLPDVCE